jgi:hypothetical protein
MKVRAAANGTSTDDIDKFVSSTYFGYANPRPKRKPNLSDFRQEGSFFRRCLPPISEKR